MEQYFQVEGVIEYGSPDRVVSVVNTEVQDTAEGGMMSKVLP